MKNYQNVLFHVSAQKSYRPHMISENAPDVAQSARCCSSYPFILSDRLKGCGSSRRLLSGSIYKKTWSNLKIRAKNVSFNIYL